MKRANKLVEARAIVLNAKISIASQLSALKLSNSDLAQLEDKSAKIFIAMSEFQNEIGKLLSKS